MESIPTGPVDVRYNWLKECVNKAAREVIGEKICKGNGSMEEYGEQVI